MKVVITLEDNKDATSNKDSFQYSLEAFPQHEEDSCVSLDGDVSVAFMYALTLKAGLEHPEELTRLISLAKQEVDTMLGTDNKGMLH